MKKKIQREGEREGIHHTFAYEQVRSYGDSERSSSRMTLASVKVDRKLKITQHNVFS